MRAAWPVLLDLFGTCNIIASAGLPCNLSLFREALPPASGLTVKRLIDEHTLLPYYVPFLPAEREAQLREDMEGSGGPSVYMRSGVMASKVPLPEWFRFCPSCKAEDERRHGVASKAKHEERSGETYWRRLHQLPGVLVCPTHEVFLEQSEARIKYARNQSDFFTAAQSTPEQSARALDQTDPGHSILVKLARCSSWLLSAKRPAVSLVGLRNRYLRLMIARGLASYSGCIRADELIRRFRQYYPAGFLKALRCELGGRDVLKDNWLLRLVRDPKHVQPPLHHLLLIIFLGLTAEEFFSLPEELNYFGEAPWPCLNPASGHCGEGKIISCEISYRGKNHRPVGTFSCECGFVYARTGPDKTPEDRHRISKMKAFGPVWEDALRSLWADLELSINGIAARLGVDPLTVRRYAVKLQLAASRRVRPLSPALQLKTVNPKAEQERKRRKHRALWLEAMKGRPKPNMKSLRGNLPRTYAWLIQNDATWFKTHRPKPAKRARIATSVDWERRDSKLALAVRESASRLKATPGKPVHITKTAVGRDLGQVTLLRQKIHKLPLTAAALDEVVESRADFAIRRVRRAAELFSQEGAQPRACELITRANVYGLMSMPCVVGAVNEALRMFEEADYAKAG